MAQSYADIAQALRDRPAINYSSSKTPIAQVWYETATVPADCFGSCPLLVITEDRTGIDVSPDVAGNQNGLYFELNNGTDTFRIYLDVDPWGDVAPVEPPAFGVVQIKQNATAAEVAAAVAEQVKCFCDENDFFEQVKVFAKGDQIFIDAKNGTTLFSDAGTTGYTTSVTSVTVCNPNIPEEFRIGSTHPCCPYLELIDAWMTGGDDHHVNWIKVYEVDYGKLEDACDDFSTDDLLGDVTETDFPYFDDSRRITEQIDIVNPECYARKPQCSPHPCYPNALLVSEKLSKDGAKASVVRVYHDVADLAQQAKFGFEVTYECQDSGNQYPIVTWTYDSKLEDYAPPQCGSAIPINQGGDLDFTSLGLVLIEPPTFEAENTCFGRVTAKYGRLPGYLKASEQTDDDYGTIYEYNQVVPASTPLPAIGSTYEGNPVLNAEIVEEHCCVKKLRVITGEDAECIKVSILPDQAWCSLTRYEWKNADGTYVLPETGDTYSGRIVLDATSQQTKCAGELQIRIDTVLVPSPVATTISDDATFCEITTETWVDLTENVTLPALGDSYGSGLYVVGASSSPRKCDKFSTIEIQTSELPSPLQTSTKEDNDFCEVTTVSYVDLASNVASIDLGDDYAPIPGTKVIAFNSEPYKCAELQRVTITVAPFPAPVIRTEIEDNDFCEAYRNTQILTADELVASPLPAIGDVYGSEWVIGVDSSPYLCDSLVRTTVISATVPSVVKTSTRKDNDFCEVSVVSFIDLVATGVGHAVGDVALGGTIIEVSVDPYKCDTLQRVTYTVAPTFPAPVIRTEIEDNDFCEAYRNTQVVTAAELATTPLPEIGDVYGSEWVIGVDSDPYLCDSLIRTTIISATVPSVVKESARPDRDLCEVTSHSFVDLTATALSYAVGDSAYAGTVIAVRVDPYKCDTLRRVTYEVATIPSPEIETETEDANFCSKTTYTKVVKGAALSLPAIGGSYQGGTVIALDSAPYLCDQLLKQSITVATVPSPEVVLEQDDKEFCSTTVYERIQPDTYNAPAIGDTYNADTVVAVSESAYLCDQLKRVRIVTANLTNSQRTTKELHPELCFINRTTWVGADGYALPDTTYNNEQVYRASSEAYHCSTLKRYSIETVPVPTTVFKEIQIDDAILGATETHHQFYDGNSPVLPAVGDTYDSEEVVGVRMDQAACKMKKVTIITSNIPEDYDHFETVAYTFPPIYRYRVELPLTVKARVSYSFTTNPAIVALLSPQSFISNIQSINNAVDVNGVPLRSQIAQPWRDLGNTLHDQINLFNPGTSRAIPDLAVVVSASVPSATTYLGWISGGTEFVLSDSIEKWKGNIWVRKTVRIVAH